MSELGHFETKSEAYRGASIGLILLQELTFYALCAVQFAPGILRWTVLLSEGFFGSGGRRLPFWCGRAGLRRRRIRAGSPRGICCNAKRGGITIAGSATPDQAYRIRRYL